jgi:hypothetical protein
MDVCNAAEDDVIVPRRLKGIVLLICAAILYSGGSEALASHWTILVEVAANQICFLLWVATGLVMLLWSRRMGFWSAITLVAFAIGLVCHAIGPDAVPGPAFVYTPADLGYLFAMSIGIVTHVFNWIGDYA